MSKEKPYDRLAEVFETTGSGERLGFHESLDRVVGLLEYDLDDIAEGEFNGLSIRDDQKAEKLAIATHKVLAMAAAVQAAIQDAGGQAEKVFIDAADYKAFAGETVIDLDEARTKVLDGLNLWFQRARDFEGVALPLDPNDPKRGSKEIHIDDLSEVLDAHNNPRPFV